MKPSELRNLLIQVFGHEPFQSHEISNVPAFAIALDVHELTPRVAGMLIARNRDALRLVKARIGPTRRQGWRVLRDGEAYSHEIPTLETES